MNVKLVASLRQKVKAKVKASLEGNAADKKEINKKNLIQKVCMHSNIFVTLLSSGKAVFDELVALVDPGVEPYKPKKGQPNIIMAVGLQVWFAHLRRIDTWIYQSTRETAKLRPAQN